MYKNVLQSIDNIAIWPIISLSIFFIFFIMLLWWVFTVDKKYIRQMENMPFDHADEPSTTTNTNL
ncbi:MAG: cbb3-type cytochrome c oxidase subunit 3 [Cyclobacteriaceae bacterium]|nr:cbb3-type cytochrome c oxidase subunit 3 [Cyclobacteriaceae bacterium]UYN87973.1 MAG: cbb3-type cytochrome c oxidase subunit 3 [Cyclobacteriaceae bacterium]